MAFFGLMRDRAVTDPVLGEFARSRGYWRGRFALGASRDVPLLMIGGREGPDSAALALARELPSRYPSLQGPIGAALLEHHLPYWQAMDAGEAEQKVPPWESCRNLAARDRGPRHRRSAQPPLRRRDRLRDCLGH